MGHQRRQPAARSDEAGWWRGAAGRDRQQHCSAPMAQPGRDASSPGKSGLLMHSWAVLLTSLGSCPGGLQQRLELLDPQHQPCPPRESAAVVQFAGQREMQEAHEGSGGCWGQGAVLAESRLSHCGCSGCCSWTRRPQSHSLHWTVCSSCGSAALPSQRRQCKPSCFGYCLPLWPDGAAVWSMTLPSFAGTLVFADR